MFAQQICWLRYAAPPCTSIHPYSQHSIYFVRIIIDDDHHLTFQSKSCTTTEDPSFLQEGAYKESIYKAAGTTKQNSVGRVPVTANSPIYCIIQTPRKGILYIVPLLYNEHSAVAIILRLLQLKNLLGITDCCMVQYCTDYSIVYCLE